MGLLTRPFAAHVHQIYSKLSALMQSQRDQEQVQYSKWFYIVPTKVLIHYSIVLFFRCDRICKAPKHNRRKHFQTGNYWKLLDISRI